MNKIKTKAMATRFHIFKNIQFIDKKQRLIVEFVRLSGGKIRNSVNIVEQL